MNELKMEDVKGFCNFLWVELVASKIESPSRRQIWRKPLSPGLKLVITLRYLGSGDNYHSLMYGFRLAHNTISLLIRDVCEAIIAKFAEEVMPCPMTPAE